MAGCFERSLMADWHPILAAREKSPGHWYLIDGLGKPYGQVRFVKRGNQVGYRADRCDERGTPTVLVGYYRGLKPATGAVHQAFLQSHGATGAPNGTGIIQGHGLNQSALR
jgi:hypothetical protein